MEQIKFIGMLIAVLFAFVNQSKAAAVTATACPNGKNDCTVLHSECVSAMCKCSDGYKEDSGDNSICVKIPVSDTSCADNDDADCKDQHSVCDDAVTSPKCKCADGYTEDSNDKSTCVIIAASAAVSATTCGSGGTGCTDAHSECDDNTQKPMCKCSDGYKEDSRDQSTCVIIPAAAAAVSPTRCGSEGAGCTDAHSVCDNNAQTPTCKCADGYKEDSNDGSTCVIIPAVLDTACPNGDGECTAASSVCDGADTLPKCKCSDGFRQDTKDHTKCKKELGQACSEGECLTNAECDTKCKCSDEHIEKDGLCVVPSSTIKAGLSEIVMMMWVFCVVILKLF